MLMLDATPGWQNQEGLRQELPCTLPACLLIFLAIKGDWVGREYLADFFWPNASRQDALHHLRVNLHRLRQLLQRLGQSEQLDTDKFRLRLRLPVQGDGGPEFLGNYCWPNLPAFEMWVSQRQTLILPDLPGRDQEIAQLSKPWLGLLVLTGEPGIGKSYLMHHCFPQAAYLYCRPGMQGLAYYPLVSFLREHSEEMCLANEWRLDLARLLPELAADQPLPALDRQTARHRLFEALALAFESLPVCLCLEDLHWLDQASAEWLSYYCQRPAAKLLASSRNMQSNPATEWLWHQLVQAGRAHQLPLSGLDLATLASLYPGSSQSHLQDLHRHTQGNPFFVNELQMSQWQVATEQGLPDTVQQVIHLRLLALAKPARECLQVLAIVQKPVSLTQLEQVTRLDSQQLFPILEELRQEHWLSSDSLSCKHELVRQVVVAQLGQLRRLTWHRQIAQRLALSLSAQELVWHYHEAGDSAAAAPHQLELARQLQDLGEFEEASELRQRVLQQSRDPAILCSARLALAHSLLLHDLAQGRQALQDFMQQVSELKPRALRKNLQGRALAALLEHLVFAGDMSQALSIKQKLEQILPDLATLEQIIAFEALLEWAFRAPALDFAATLLQRAWLTGLRPATVCSLEAQYHWFCGDIQRARTCFERLVRDFGHFRRGITMENDLACMLYWAGDLAQARAYAEASLQSWQDVPHTLTLSFLILAHIELSAGQWQQARKAIEQAQQLAQQQQSALFLCEVHLRWARYYELQDQVVAARASLQLAAPLLSGEPIRNSHYALLQALLARTRGELPDARMLHDLAQSRHGLVRVRLAWIQVLSLRLQVDFDNKQPDQAALNAALEMEQIASQAGMQEMRVQAICLQGRYAEAQHLAQQAGYASLLCKFAAEPASASQQTELALAMRDQTASTPACFIAQFPSDSA